MPYHATQPRSIHEQIYMEKILKSRITAVSGWGVGIVILFILFRGKIELVGEPARFTDMLLTMLVAIFSLLLATAISIGNNNTQNPAFEWNQNGWLRRILSPLIPALAIIIGWLIMTLSKTETVVPMATATLGAIISGAGCVISYFSIVRIFRKNKI